MYTSLPLFSLADFGLDPLAFQKINILQSPNFEPQAIRLDFGILILVHPNILEVIIDDGVEMNEEMVSTYNATLDELLPEEGYLLINKINPYSYTFDGMRNIANLDKIKAMAIVSYRSETDNATRVVDFTRKTKNKLETFKSRESALAWLLDLIEAK